MSLTTTALNARFAIPSRLHFADSGTDLPVAHITTAHASASLALQGAQILTWQPQGQEPVIWVSKAAVYQTGKGVRGGVPVCWPWFGAMEGKGAHGFVRTRMWTLRETSTAPDGSVVLRLGMVDDAVTRAVWDHAFDLELIVTVGSVLTMALITHNTGATPFSITEGLHTYFCVGDIHQTSVLGLEDTDYSDKVAPFGTVRQTGAVRFGGETDRVYLNTQADCLIHDPVLQRVIRISKTGSNSSVVWNPWTEKEKTFADMATGEYQGMLCVETVNAGTDCIRIGAGETHTMAAVIAVE